MIEGVDLHDATLNAVRVSWEDGKCIMNIEHGTLGKCVLTFSAVSYLTLPRKQSWGRSVSINSFSVSSSGQYEIEMQSGDLIKIEATYAVLTKAGQSAF
ncbi:hypothetical protein [Pseudomonas sp. EpS/L25]|uniref:hypothetical protein n=1 Tax=Pseudomonas sp. EpS/L25 TaxID=1749078 RepID=UPI0007435172|nr:hypothetical protein [Pseudomonas sp. EpS/L25]KUM40130.1 hypothetical protein AR540_12610 [Pseudomonas sp. EpS/L25]